MSEQAERNKEIRRRMIAARNLNDLTVLDELVAEDWRFHQDGLAVGVGREGLRALWDRSRKQGGAFPDSRMTVELQVADDDFVVTRWTYESTHTGTLRLAGVAPIPPTGRKVRSSGVVIDRIVDGRIAETWETTDHLSMLRCIDALPTPDVTTGTSA